MSTIRPRAVRVRSSPPEEVEPAAAPPGLDEIPPAAVGEEAAVWDPGTAADDSIGDVEEAVDTEEEETPLLDGEGGVAAATLSFSFFFGGIFHSRRRGKKETESVGRGSELRLKDKSHFIQSQLIIDSKVRKASKMKRKCDKNL